MTASDWKHGAAEGGSSFAGVLRARAFRMVERRPWRTAMVAFVLGWAFLSLPWLSGAVTIPYDAKAHFHAQIQFLANAIHSGQSPFWNPDAFAGQPHVADPQSLIFSPAILLALFSPSPSFQMVDGFVLALLGAGGLAVLLIFREMRWAPAGAVVAALAFSFGASAALRIQHVGQVQSLVFLLIAHLLLVRLLRSPSWLAAGAYGAAAAMMVIEPDQVALLGAYVLLAHAIWLVAGPADRRMRIRCFGPYLLLAAAVCVAIVAIPLTLTYLFVESTTRPMVGFAEAAAGSLHPASLLTALIADLFGAIDRSIEYWGPFSVAWGDKSHALTQNMGHIYIGALPALAIVFAGLLGGHVWEREIRFYAATALFMLVYALGVHTPLFRLCYDYMPGIAGFRRPADATFLLGAYGAILGGYLVNHVLARLDSERGSSMVPAFVACALIFAAGAGLAIWHGKFGEAAPKLLAAMLWCGCAGALAIAIRRRGLASGGAAALALGSFMAADLWANNGPNESTALPPAEFDVLRPASVNPTICEIKKSLSVSEAPDRRDRVEIVGVGFHWPNAGLVHGFENILGYNPLHLGRYSRATGARDQAAGWDQRNFSPLFPSYRSLLADMLGLRLIVSGVPVEQIDKRLKPGDLHLIARTADGWIYENPRALPRVVFTRDWRVADFDALIENGQWPDFDPRKTVLLDSAPNPPPPGQSTQGETSLRIVHYENTRIEIELEAAEAGFVVLNDIWHPWWNATVDAKPAEILKANVLFRAVQTGAGRHRIVFEFSPVSLAFSELRARVAQGIDARE